MAYVRQKSLALSLKGGEHRDSLTVSKHDVEEWSTFLWNMAQKLGNTSQKALETQLVSDKVKLDDHRRVALDLLNVS